MTKREEVFNGIQQMQEIHKTVKQRRSVLAKLKNELHAEPWLLAFFERIFLDGHPRGAVNYWWSGAVCTITICP